MESPILAFWLSPDSLHLVAQLFEQQRDAVPQVALDFDDAILHGAPSSTFVLEDDAEVANDHFAAGDLPDQRHAFPAASFGFASDADGR